MAASDKNVKVTIQKKDRGWNKIEALLKKYRGGIIAKVGIQGAAASQDHEGMTNAQLATIHEFGSQARPGSPPERSFLRSTFDDYRWYYQRELDFIAYDLFGGGDPRGDLLLLGEEFRRDIIQNIQAGIDPPLSQSTFDRRAASGPSGSTPLWATGQLVNAISAELHDLRGVDR